MAAFGNPEVPLVETYAAGVLSGSSTRSHSCSPHLSSWFHDCWPSGISSWWRFRTKILDWGIPQESAAATAISSVFSDARMNFACVILT